MKIGMYIKGIRHILFKEYCYNEMCKDGNAWMSFCEGMKENGQLDPRCFYCPHYCYDYCLMMRIKTIINERKSTEWE